ncbi:hypothetical protein SAMN05518865_12531 [Duganella sp. CF458]|nr:hypothetical protein SAMN05518865_12531 [Duganella sp. CF458]
MRSVQVAFDVETQVIDAVRLAAFKSQLSTSDQIRKILGLPYATKPVRPRLTVSLSDADYALLGERLGVDAADRRRIKEILHEQLIEFAKKQSKHENS